MLPSTYRPAPRRRKDEKMFTIYYNNGLRDKCDGTLDDAKAMADECASYTQCDITIEDENREEVAHRRWYGVPFDPSETESTEDEVIQFGTFGFYDRWE